MKETNKSPNWHTNETEIARIAKSKKSNLIGVKFKKKGANRKDKENDPTIPLKVLFGLIFVNFFPLKILPNKKPPISENTQIDKK